MRGRERREEKNYCAVSGRLGGTNKGGNGMAKEEETGDDDVVPVVNGGGDGSDCDGGGEIYLMITQRKNEGNK